MVEHFKNELKNLTYYKESLAELDDSLTDARYELTGVKGLRYDKPPGGFSPEAKKENYYKLSSEIEHLIDEQERIQKQVNYIETVLDQIEDQEIKEAAIKVFAENKTLRKVSKEYYMSYTTLHKKINKELKEAIRRSNGL